jgi:[acyl-carrier-protein] S-malonyltransferase
MQDAVPIGVGTMAAIIGLENDKVLEACKMASDAGVVEAANFNCPGQIVLSGDVKAVEKACEICKQNGAKRALILPVSAPFHSSLLKKAQDELAAELKTISFSEMKYKVVSNVTARTIDDPSQIKDLLIKQVTSSVLWWNSMEYMIKNGVDTFIEIGPGKTLTGFLKKINSDVKSYNISTVDELNAVISAVKAEV